MAAVIEHARETLRVGFDPGGGVIHGAVFPCAEPEHD